MQSLQRWQTKTVIHVIICHFNHWHHREASVEASSANKLCLNYASIKVHLISPTK